MNGVPRKYCVLLQCVLSCVAAVSAESAFSGDDYPPYCLVSRCRTDRQVNVPRMSFRADWQKGRNIAYAERLTDGYTIVLPGVLGTTPYNTKLIRLLKEGSTAVEYFDWTDGVPLFMRRGLRKNRFNEANARNLRRRILEYQERYPGRPVYVIALCAGAGPACEAIASLPVANRIERAILLGPALSPGYDLRPALNRTNKGIDSFHSPLDVPVLMALTTVVGTVDGQHMPAAGAVGFGWTGRRIQALRQHMYNPKMLMQGHLGGHFGWTATRFVNENVIPLLTERATIRASSDEYQ